MLNYFTNSNEGESKKDEELKLQTKEGSMNEFLINSKKDDKLHKSEIKKDASAYFTSLNECEERRIISLSHTQADHLIRQGYEKRLEIFLERIKKWKYLYYNIKIF